MKVVAIFLLRLAVLNLVNANGCATNLNETISHLCTSWGRSIGQQFRLPKVGKAGPRGFPGPIGPPGVVNETIITALVREEIDSALQSVWPRSCRNIDRNLAKIRRDTGGVYNLYPLGFGEVEVFCDETTDGGGWTVFQRRIDGSVDFYRGWNDYVNGFGDRKGEFWLGLEAIHRMTRQGNYELRIDMIKTDGTSHYAQYGSFAVGPGSDYYRISVGEFYGNSVDNLSWHSNMQFSTKDNDRDTWTRNCASYFTGAWWFRNCRGSHLNGIYGRAGGNGVFWNENNRFTEMKFRKKS